MWTVHVGKCSESRENEALSEMMCQTCVLTTVTAGMPYLPFAAASNMAMALLP